MQTKSLNRRLVLSGLGAIALQSVLVMPAFSLTKDGAEKLINDLSADIFRVINSGKTGNSMYRDFEKVFAKYADVPIIARSTLGVAWRSASGAQKSAYTKAFSGYLSRKYGRRFQEFIGSEIKVTSAKKVKSGYLVKSRVSLKGQSSFEVEWQVSDKSGKSKMFNLYIEGINMLLTERTEIGAMLDKRGGKLDKLIADLKKIG